jgi:hypothetical protein
MYTVQKFSSYRSGETVRFHNKIARLMLCKEILTGYSDNHTKYTNYNVGKVHSFNIEASDTYSYIRTVPQLRRLVAGFPPRRPRFEL